jgi:hypothetical protein
MKGGSSGRRETEGLRGRGYGRWEVLQGGAGGGGGLGVRKPGAATATVPWTAPPTQRVFDNLSS